MKPKHHAFTLIELLVVVLIIGILAAIAVPQYQVAITKTRVSSLLPIARHIKDAQEIYYATYGTYTDPIENLGISLPAACTVTPYDSSQVNCGRYTIDNVVGSISSLSERRVGIKYLDKNRDAILRLSHYFDHSEKPNTISCLGYTSEGVKVCRALGFEVEEN